MAVKKKARSKDTLVSSIVDQFDGTIAEHPIAVAHKAVLKGLGLAKQFQADLQEKYDDLAKDGEIVRDRVEDSIGSLQSRVVGQLKSKRAQVEKGVTSAVRAILDYAPVAKSSDIEKLNHKLDKVLSQVAS
jgi:polyhydroxyalkanoate synthesis regulator phasin